MKQKKKLSDDEIIEEIKAIWATITVDDLIKNAHEHDGAGNCLRQLIEQFQPFLMEMAEKNNEPLNLEELGKLLVAAGATIIASARFPARFHEAQESEAAKGGPRFELPADPFKGRVSFNN